MINWIIILVVILVIAGIWLYYSSKNEWAGGFAMSFVMVFISLFALIIIIANGLSYYAKAVDYKLTPPTVITSATTLENAQAIIDLKDRNEWIAEAKLQRAKWGSFSLYPAFVVDLQETNQTLTSTQ